MHLKRISIMSSFANENDFRADSRKSKSNLFSSWIYSPISDLLKQNICLMILKYYVIEIVLVIKNPQARHLRQLGELRGAICFIKLIFKLQG